MQKRNGSLYIVLTVLAVLLVTGVVYAAVSGILSFGGTSRFASNVQLMIVSPVVANPEAGDSATVNAAGDTLNFSVLLLTPGESRQVSFHVENVGNTAARLGAISPSDLVTDSGITVNWPQMEGDVIEAGATGDVYTVTVYWDPAYAGTTQEAAFSATINYEQAMAS